MIITDEVFKNSMSKNHFLEYESIERFSSFCKKYGFDLIRNQDNSSATDCFINGFKIQMKYSSKPYDKRQTMSSYAVNLKRTADYNKYRSYKKGENDFYVIEIGSYHEDFLILPEQTLIDKDIISTKDLLTSDEINNENKKTDKYKLYVFPYNHVEKKLLISKENQTGCESKITGNWTTDKQYWFSTENGPLSYLIEHKSDNFWTRLFINKEFIHHDVL
jgi:hypothetical protein